MRSNPHFVKYVKDLLAGGPQIKVRASAGGHGLFREGLMVGVVSDDLLYLRAHGERGERLRMRGAGQLKGEAKRQPMPFYRAPDDALDDPEYAKELAELAFRDALSADREQPPSKRRHRP